MWEFIIGLLTNITSSWFSKLNLPRLLSNSQTKFWDPILREGFVIVTPARDEEAEVKSQVLDFQGLDELKTQVIHKYYQHVYRQTTCDNLSNEWLHRNLLLVAGPIANTTTRHILSQENTSVRYLFNGNNIIDRQNPEKVILADTGMRGYPSIDYGIISKLRNPFNRRKWVIIASGMWGWGTYSALAALTKNEILDFLRQHAGNNEFQVLVQTKIFNQIPEEPILLSESLHIVTAKKGA